MGAAIEGMIGARFGNLVVVAVGQPRLRKHHAPEKAWACRCDCGNERTATTDKLRSGRVHSCGCADRRVPKRSALGASGWTYDAARFAANTFPDPNSGCWIYDGVEAHSGYCYIYIYRDGVRKMAYAHRAAWLIAGRNLPDGAVVRHLCNTRLCVNPDHLAIGTRADNMADMAIAERAHRGRLPRGVRARGHGLYDATYTIGRQKFLVGTYGSVEEAAEAVRVARAKMFADRGIKLVYPAP